MLEARNLRSQVLHPLQSIDTAFLDVGMRMRRRLSERVQVARKASRLRLAVVALVLGEEIAQREPIQEVLRVPSRGGRSRTIRSWGRGNGAALGRSTSWRRGIEEREVGGRSGWRDQDRVRAGDRSGGGGGGSCGGRSRRGGSRGRHDPVRVGVRHFEKEG
ncbi:hypothetical protein C8R46DRAFT_1068345 [Mycena filopes]|nr:hypothetical protein C8R46DRAFT_1068345 [Mycena filopes]